MTVPRFLSPEWADAVAAATGSLLLPGEPTVTVAHLVEGAPGGDLSWVVRVAGGRVSVALRPGLDPAEADIVFVEDYETACALARGDLTAEQAVGAGRLKLRRGAQALVTHAGTLRALGEALAGLRSATTW